MPCKKDQQKTLIGQGTGNHEAGNKSWTLERIKDDLKITLHVINHRDMTETSLQTTVRRVIKLSAQ